MTVLIRPARLTDAGAVGGILSDWIETTAWTPRVHSRAQDIGFADTMIARGWVDLAMDQRRVIGFIARDGDKLHSLYLAAGACGRGIGRQLLDSAKANRARLEVWTFQANVEAQKFYLREGFVEAKRTMGQGNDQGLPDIRFVWRRGAGDQKENTK